MKTHRNLYAGVANMIASSIEAAKTPDNLTYIMGMIVAFRECFEYDENHRQMILTLLNQWDTAYDRIEGGG